MSPQSRRSVLGTVAGSLAALCGCLSRDGETDTTESSPSNASPRNSASETPGSGRTTRDATSTPGTDARTETQTEAPTETPATLSPGGSRPAMFVHLDTLAAIRERVDAGEEPWATAHEWFMADVSEAFSAETESVTTGGQDHAFASEGPDEPEERDDYETAIRVGDRVRDLGLAYQLTGEDEYARRAVDYLNCWFLADDTYMSPEPTASVELFITLPKMWWGAELVRGHDAWRRDAVGDESDLEEWVATFLEPLSHEVPTTFGQQNIFNWKELIHAAGAVYLRDWERLRTAMTRNRETGFDQLREDGLLENEIIRDTSLTYSVFAMKALTTAAEISRLYADRLDGPTLYEHSKFDGDRPALERMYDAHAPYIVDPESWKAQGSESDDRFRMAYDFPARSMEKAGSLYELAYSRFGKDAYLEVVTAGGRPVKNLPTYVDAQQEPIEDEGRPRRDERILGWTTLTHGELFRLEEGGYSNAE